MKSISINKTSKFKIKQKDYTIPVRLKQQIIMSIKSNNHKRNYEEQMRQGVSSWSLSTKRVIMITGKRSCKYKISSLKCEKIRRPKLGLLHSKQLPGCLILTIIAIIITLTANTNKCFCDRTTSLKSSISGQISDLTTINKKGIADNDNKYNNNNNNYDYTKQKLEAQKNSKINVNPKFNEKNHKNNLMTVLSDNIERQHFKMKPINVFVHKRPSKFDSGDDDLLSGDDYIDQLHQSSIITTSSFKDNNKQLNNNSFIKGKQKSNSIDENMNHIINLHATQIKPSITSNHQLTKTTPSTVGNKWKDRISNGGLNPVKVASNLINQNKMISQIFSYINPLVSGTKLLDNEQSNLSSVTNDFEKTKSSSQQTIISYPEQHKNDNNILTTKFINSFINPFVARSINNHFFGGLETNKFHQTSSILRSPVTSSSSSSSKSNFVVGSTVSPAQQSLYLPKPPEFLDKKLKTGRQTSTVGPQQSSIINLLELSSKDLDSSSSLLSESNQPAPGVAVNSPEQTTRDNFVSATNKASNSNLPSDSLVPFPWSIGAGASIKPNQMAHNYIQDSFRALLTLSQLPILPGGQISTAPSVLERVKNKVNDSNNGNKNNKTTTHKNNLTQQLFLFPLLSEEQRRRALDELYRYAYILGTGVRRKRDPLKALASTSLHNQIRPLFNFGSLIGSNGYKFKGSPSQRNNNQQQLTQDHSIKGLKSLLNITGDVGLSNKAKPRGVIWDMATDPSLAVTVFHLMERASVALPLGFLLMPFVHMIRNPFSGIGLSRILPPRASHRSVDYEELAKRLDVVDKMLSRALRSTHRDSSSSFIG